MNQTDKTKYGTVNKKEIRTIKAKERMDKYLSLSKEDQEIQKKTNKENYDIR